MVNSIDKIRSNTKIALGFMAVVKIALALAAIIFIVLFLSFSSSKIVDVLFSFMIPSYFLAAISGSMGLWVLIIYSLGWLVSIGLLVNIEERVWIPSASLSLLSTINICCCILAIIFSDRAIIPYMTIIIIYDAVIILLAVLYLVFHTITRKQMNLS